MPYSAVYIELNIHSRLFELVDLISNFIPNCIESTEAFPTRYLLLSEDKLILDFKPKQKKNMKFSRFLFTQCNIDSVDGQKFRP